MAYTPKNVAKFRDDSSRYPKGTGDGVGPGTVPGTTGSNDRGSQLKDFIGGGERVAQKSFNILDGGNENNPRTKDNHGSASYKAAKPTL